MRRRPLHRPRVGRQVRERFSLWQWLRERRRQRTESDNAPEAAPKPVPVPVKTPQPAPKPVPVASPPPVEPGRELGEALLLKAGRYLGRDEVTHASWVGVLNRRAAGCPDHGACWLSATSPWCGSFMAQLCRELGLEPPRNAFRASSWINYGRPVTLADAKPGDVVVITRPGGNHVGLFLEQGAGWVRLRGGNQSNRVTDNYKVDKSRVRYVGRISSSPA